MSVISGRIHKKITANIALTNNPIIVKGINVTKVGASDTLEIRRNGIGTPAAGTVTLDTGASGSVDGITVNAIEIMSGAVAFDTDLDTTATAVAANITANTSSPDYNAVAVGSVITITAVNIGNCEDANGFVVVSSTTTITSTDVNLSGGLGGQIVLEAMSLSGIISIPLNMTVNASPFAVFTGSTAEVLLIYD